MIRDAIIVTHGMGAQIRFQSVDAIVQGLKRVGGLTVRETRGRSVQVEGSPPMQRVELKIEMPDGSRRELHLYEAYWAPLTEGNVGIWDTVKFLISGGLNGVLKRGRSFYRILFGHEKYFEVPLSATTAISAVALAIASLLLFNFVASVVVLKGWWQSETDAQLLRDLMTVIGLVVHTIGWYVVVLALAWVSKASPPVSKKRREIVRFFSATAYPAMFGVVLAMIAGALLVLLLIGRKTFGGIDALWWSRHWLAIAVPALGIAAFGYFLGVKNQRLASLLRLLGHLGAATLCAVLLVWVAWPVERYLAWTPTVGACLHTAGLNPPAASIDPEQPNESALPAGLYTKLFKCNVTATAYPWTMIFLGSVLLYVAAVVIVVRQQHISMLPLPDDPMRTALMVIFGAVAFPLGTYLSDATANVAVLRLLGVGQIWPSGNRSVFLIPWVGILAAGILVRGFLVGFVGDVAAYVASHKLDRFHEVRTKIKETVEAVFRTVYLLKTAGQPAYRQVAVVGHSLGSVISFDALNAMQLEDTLQPDKQLNVNARTTLLLTFGSPLDKIAYVYSTLTTETDMTRELLTGAAKPLISDPQTRANLAWINIWSQCDIISGSLEFYDYPHPPATDVLNFRDPYATTPLAAHVEYFENDLMYVVLGVWHSL